MLEACLHILDIYEGEYMRKVYNSIENKPTFWPAAYHPPGNFCCTLTKAISAECADHQAHRRRNHGLEVIEYIYEVIFMGSGVKSGPRRTDGSHSNTCVVGKEMHGGF